MHRRLLLVLLPALLTGCPRKSAGDDDDDGGGDGGGWDLGDAGDSGVTDGTDSDGVDTPDTDTDTDTDTDGTDTDGTDTDGTDTDTDGTDTPDTDTADTDTADTDADTDADTSVDLDPQIGTVDPAYGSTAGSTLVRIGGTDLGTVTSVRFGTRTATIVSTSDDELVVRTPAATAQDPVDVQIDGPDGGDTLVDGFSYFLPGSGLTAAIGTIGHVDYLGGYWSEPGLEAAAATIAFIEPIGDFELWSPYGSRLDSCAEIGSYSGGGEFTAVDVLADEIELVAGADRVDLPWIDADFHFEDTALAATRVDAAAAFDLRPMDSRWIPSIEVTDFAEIPREWTVSSPDIDGSSLASVDPSGLDFAWSGGTVGDYMLIEVLLSTSSGTAIETGWVCVARDDGAFSITASTVGADWAADRIVYIQMYRMQDSDAVLPWNDGEVDVLGYYGVAGAMISTD